MSAKDMYESMESMGEAINATRYSHNMEHGIIVQFNHLNIVYRVHSII